MRSIVATGSPVFASLLMLVSPDIKNLFCSALDPAIAGIRAVTGRGSCCCWHPCYCWRTCCCWCPSVAGVPEDIIVLVLAPGSLFQAMTTNNFLLRHSKVNLKLRNMGWKNAPKRKYINTYNAAKPLPQNYQVRKVNGLPHSSLLSTSRKWLVTVKPIRDNDSMESHRFRLSTGCYWPGLKHDVL